MFSCSSVQSSGKSLGAAPDERKQCWSAPQLGLNELG